MGQGSWPPLPLIFAEESDADCPGLNGGNFHHKNSHLWMQKEGSPAVSLLFTVGRPVYK